MAETYEFPPSLIDYRPLQFDRARFYPSTLKLRHHFFLTRIKIVFKEAVSAPDRIRVDRFVQEEMFNVIISQGWCAALGVPVPTPFFVQEYLIGNYNDPDRAIRFIPSLIKLILTLEVSDIDRRFHDDIMGESGKWWLNTLERPLSFMTLWRKLESRTDDLVKAGLLSEKPWEQFSPGELGRILDPAIRTEGSTTKTANNAGKEKKRPPKRSREKLNRIIRLLDEHGIPDIQPSKEEMQDLEQLDLLTQTQNQLERLKDIEAEIVETQKWNHDAARDLLKLSSTLNRHPFETRPELFDLRPTSTDYSFSKAKGKQAEATGGDEKIADTMQPALEGNLSTGNTSSKGKERAIDPPKKRSIYHYLPDDAKESWLGMPDQPIPPMNNDEESTTYSEFIEKSLPELFGVDVPHHECVYRDLLLKFVEEDLRKVSTERLDAQETVLKAASGYWETTAVPPLPDPLPATQWNDRHIDPVPGIFEQIAMVASAPVPRTTSPPTAPPSSDSEPDAVSEISDSGSENSSGWESEQSEEEGMDSEPLPLDMDTGESTFATSNTI